MMAGLGGQSGGVYAREFVSAEQTWTFGGVITVAHGLGVVPKDFSAHLVCKTAEDNFTVGQEIRADCGSVDGAAYYGVAVFADATNIYASTPAGGFAGPSGTGAGSLLTAANFKVVLKARA